MNPNKFLVSLFTLGFFTTAVHPPQGSCTALRAGSAGRAARGAPVRAVPPLLQNNLKPVTNPAFTGGIGFSVLPKLETISPSLGLPSTENNVTVAPFAAKVSVGGQTVGIGGGVAVHANKQNKKVGVAASAREFAGSLKKSGVSAAGKIRAFFDGHLNADNTNTAVGGDGASFAPASRGPLNEVVFRALKDGSDIRTNLPRTLVINDAYIKGAPAATVSRLQTLINEGVHLVILTDRADRGPGSIDEILLSKLTPSKSNPITVASHAGARISFVEAGAKWKVASEAGAFETREISRFSEIAARVNRAAKLRNVPARTESPASGDTLSVTFSLKGRDRQGDVARKRRAFMLKFNQAMKAARLPYQMKAHPSDESAAVIQAITPRLALGRIDRELGKRFADENLSAKGNETMVLLDARGSEPLMRTITADPESVPGLFRGASVVDAGDAGAQATALGAVTEASELNPVDVSMSDMRQYLDFWRPVVGRSGKTPKQSAGTSSGRYGLYTWQVLHDLLTDFYVDAARSGKKYTNVKKFLDALRMRWAGKAKDASFERYRGTQGGKVADAAYLGHALRFAGNFWQREIGNYSLAQQEIREDLMTEGKVYTKVPLRSPFTGRKYALGVSVDRVMKLDTANGRELNATVYRFGKEGATDGDEAQARAVALATLRGYGRKGLDLKWHQGSAQGPVLSRITVQIEHLNRHNMYDFTPDDLLKIEADGSISQGSAALKLVNEIESAQADFKYLASQKKMRRLAGPQEWDGDEWTQKGDAVRELFGSYFPNAPTAERLRPFLSEAEALRPKTATPRDPVEVFSAPIAWPQGKPPAPIDEEGSQIEEDLEASHRVVFIEDIFTNPAADEVVDRIQRLIDAGAHVVFMTARPHKGENSADTVLLARLKAGRANPIIVTSYNGGRIALHSRAKDPKAYIPDSRAFTAAAIKTFDATAGELAAEFDLALEAEAVPSKGSPFQYNLWIPQSVPAAELATTRTRLIKRFNKSLAAEGLEYSIQAHPGHPRQLWIRSQPMRLSLDRVFQALDQRFKGEDLLAHPDQFLVIGNSKRSLHLSKAWPKQATFRAAQNDTEISNHLGGVLGNRKRDTVGVKLGEIRSYDEFWEPMLERRAGHFGTEASQSHRLSEEDRRYHGPLAMFTGSIMYRLMPELFEAIWRGQDRTSTKTQGLQRIRQMWAFPEREGVFVSKRQASVMNEEGWKSRSRGYLERALTFFSEIYDRAFENYSEAAQDILHNMAGLTTDRQSLVTLVFKASGKLYKVFTRLPRLMKHDTEDGRVLSVIAYRTGKEPFEGDGDGVYAKTLAMTMLVGFAQPGPDRRWHDGWPHGPKIAKLHVRLEYKQGARDLYFDPNDFFRIQANGKYRQGVAVQEIANMIERMRADDEFQEHFKAENEQATAEEIKEAKKKTKGTGKKPVDNRRVKK
ncbi:MAG: hypothetical protein ABIJ96_01310 [Elusimicrobiota bacterium]